MDGLYMRILSILFPSPYGSLKADSAMYWRIWNIKRLLQSEGHEVELVCYIPQYLYKKYKYNGVENGSILKDVNFKITVIPNVRYLRDLNSYDLIYANTAWAGFNSLFGKLNRAPPVIIDNHGLTTEEYLIRRDHIKPSTMFSLGIHRLVDYISYKFSTRIICVSKKMIDYLSVNRGISRNKMDYVTNGVNLEFFKLSNDENITHLRDEFNLNDKMVFGYIGNYQKWQGVDNFVLAASKIRDKDIAIIMVGNDDYRYCNDLNIHYLPRVSRSLIPYYYSLCDVLVLPRPSHPVTEVAAPTKFAEYVSMSKPVLTTNVGDAAELVRRYKCGIVVGTNSVSNIIDGMETFSNMTARDLKNMGKNSRRLAITEFDWEKQRDNLRLSLNKISDF